MLRASAILLLFASRLFAVDATAWPYSCVAEIQAGDQGGSATLLGIYQTSGILGTAAHVVEGYTNLKARFPNGYECDGKVLGRDTELDLAAAVIYVRPGMQTPRGLRAAPRPGDKVLALGYPYYCRGKVNWLVGRVRELRDTDIIFDCSPHLQSGFSGGALLDDDGYYLGSTNGYGVDYSYAAGGPAMVKFFSRWVKVGQQ